MDRDTEIQKRLEAVFDKEWIVIVDKLTIFVHFKLRGWKMFKGAHSEQNLGIDAVNYYVNGAIEKLISLQWDWKYEKYTLFEQLKTIIGSMISTNVESFKSKKEKVILMEDKKLTTLVENETDDNSDDTYELFKEALEACSKDDDDLQLYVMALDEYNTFDEIADATGFEKKKLYVLQKKIGRRIEKYLETKKEPAK